MSAILHIMYVEICIYVLIGHMAYCMNKLLTYLLKCLFHFKIQHAKCLPSSILFTQQCDLSLQEVDYNWIRLAQFLVAAFLSWRFSATSIGYCIVLNFEPLGEKFKTCNIRLVAVTLQNHISKMGYWDWSQYTLIMYLSKDITLHLMAYCDNGC